MTRPRFYAQFALGSGTSEVLSWQDFSAYVTEAKTQRGRKRELDQDEAGTATVIAKNGDRRFDWNNASSPYYPDLKLMSRLRLGGLYPADTDSYLSISGDSGDYASAPDSAALSIAGDLDILCRVASNDWTPASNGAILGKLYLGGDTAYSIGIESPNGKLWLRWRDAGLGVHDVYSTVATGLTDGSTKWIRATLDVNNGAAGHDVKFYMSDDGTTWSQLGTTQTTAGTTTILDTALDVQIGGMSSLWAGKFYYGEIRSGIGGTVVASPDFQTPLIWRSGEADAQGNAWTLNGDAELVGTPDYIFSGLIIRMAQFWPNKRNARVRFQCVDAFHILNLKRLTNEYEAQRSDVRVAAVLQTCYWPTEDQDLSVGQSTMIASTLTDTPALEHLQHVALSEIGRLFAAASGKITFRDRHAELQPPYSESQATFGDAGGSELPYLRIADLELSEDLVYNDVKACRVEGTYMFSDDEDSQDAYFARTLTRSNLLLETDEETQRAAHFLKSRYKDAQQRIADMEFDPERSPAAMWPQALERELGDRITVLRRPPGGGDAIEQESIIEGIGHDIAGDPARWLIHWDLSPASVADYWRLNSSGLNSATRLAY